MTVYAKPLKAGKTVICTSCNSNEDLKAICSVYIYEPISNVASSGQIIKVGDEFTNTSDGTIYLDGTVSLSKGKTATLVRINVGSWSDGGYAENITESDEGEFYSFKTFDDTSADPIYSNTCNEEGFETILPVNDTTDGVVISEVSGDASHGYFVLFESHEMPTPVPYLSLLWDADNKSLVQTEEECADYTVLREDTLVWGKEGETTWYVLKDNVEIPDKLVDVYGTTNLILCDNSLLSITRSQALFSNDRGIEIHGDSTLNIYAQSFGDDAGAISSIGTNNKRVAIGNSTGGAFTVNIYGGNISAATKTMGTPGIGTYGDGTMTLNIYGGSVTAYGQMGCAGIGGASGKAGGNVTIYGGDVTAQGGSDGAGIGGGKGASCGTVIIYGGTVNATAGMYTAGIGCGSGTSGKGGRIEIYGGSVTATGGKKADYTTYSKGFISQTGVDDKFTFILGEGVKLYGSDDPESPASTFLKKGDGTAYTGDLFGFMKAELLPHEHTFTYSTSGATLTATCSVADCTLTNSKAELSIVAPARTVYGSTDSAAATLSGDTDFVSETGLTIPDIHYVGRNNTTYTDSTTAPEAAGDYTAKITINDLPVANSAETSNLKISVDYTIAKKDHPSTTAVTMSDYVYGATPGTPALVDSYSPEGSVSYYYNTTNVATGGTKWENIAGTTLNSGEYYIYASIAASDNYNAFSTAAVKFTVSKADQQTPTAPELESATATTITLKAVENCEYRKEMFGQWQDSPVFTGLSKNTSYIFYQRKKADVNHNESAASSAHLSTTAHSHAFTYVADGAKITATCSEDGCDLTDNAVTIELTISNPVYDGTAKTATISGYPETAVEGLAEKPTANKISYYNSKGAGSTEKDGNPMNGAPVNAGNYVAEVTWGEKTAVLGFSIAKADVTLSDDDKPSQKLGMAYTGEEIDLVSAPKSQTYTVKYALTESDVAPDASLYSDSIPKVTDAGTYYVWYFVPGDDNRNDTTPVFITATIAKAAAPTLNEDQKPTEKDISALKYSGSDIALLNAPEKDAPENYTVKYAIGTSDETEPSADSFTTTIPTGKDAGTYYVWYKIVGDDNHADYPAVCTTVTISKADAIVLSDDEKPTVAKKDDGEAITFTGASVTLVKEAKEDLPEGYVKYVYALGTKDQAPSANEFIQTMPSATNAGTYYVWFKAIADDNHTDTEPEMLEVVLSKRSIEHGFIIFDNLKDPDLPEYFYTGQNISVTPVEIELYIEELDDYYYIQSFDFEVDTQNSVLEAKEQGTYKVNVKVKENTNFTGILEGEWYIKKGEPVITTLPTASEITFGQTLSASVLTGGVAQSCGVDVPGKFDWYYPDRVPFVTESGVQKFGIIFIPDDTENFYYSVSLPENDYERACVALTVNPADELKSTLVINISNGVNDNGIINLTDHIIDEVFNDEDDKPILNKDEFDHYEITDIDASAGATHISDAITLDATNLIENKSIAYKLSKEVTPGCEASIKLYFNNPNYKSRQVLILVKAKSEIVSDELVLENVFDLYYTGYKLKQTELNVYCAGKLLEEGKDYKVTYKNNKNVGTATITVKGIGNYKGTGIDTFEILPIDISNDEFTADDIYLTYNNKNQKKTPVLKRNGKKISQSNYTVEYFEAGTTLETENPKPAADFKNSYVVILSGKGKNYDPNGKRLVNVIITGKNVALAKNAKIKLDKASYVLGDYLDGVVIPKIESLKVKNKEFKEGEDYEVVLNNNTDIGKGTIEIIGNGTTISGSKTFSFKIVGTSIKSAELTGIPASITYDPTFKDGNRVFGYKLALNGKELVQDVDYSVSYKNNNKVGKATIIFEGIGNYTGKKTATFKINPAEIYDGEYDEGCYISTLPVAQYHKNGALPYLKVYYYEEVLVEGVDYTVTYKNNLKVTDETVGIMTIKGIGNYTGKVVKNFSVYRCNVDNLFGNIGLEVTDKNYKLSANKPIKSVLQVPKTTDLETNVSLKNNTDFNINYYVSTDGKNYKLLLGSDKRMTLKNYLKKNYKGFDYDANGITIKCELVFDGGYRGKVSTTYRVADYTLSSVKYKVATKTYTGDEITFNTDDINFVNDFIIYKGENLKTGKQLAYGVDYVIEADSYKNNIKKGTASVKIRGIGKYSGTKTIKFKIVKKNL